MHHYHRGHGRSNGPIRITVPIERLHYKELKGAEDHHGEKEENSQEQQKLLHSIQKILGSSFLERNIGSSGLTNGMPFNLLTFPVESCSKLFKSLEQQGSREGLTVFLPG